MGNMTHPQPFGGRRQQRPTVQLADARNGMGERLIGANGELNAGSKSELIKRQGQLIQIASSSRLAQTAGVTAQQKAEQRKAALAAAFRDPEKHRALGAAMGDELYITQQREGIMRGILNYMEVTDGVTPMIKLRKRDITATYATGPTQTQTQFVRDAYFYPVEYYLVARPYIEQAEIVRNNTDILEDKYLEATQALVVQEDRIFIQAVKKTIGQSNPFTTQVGTMNPFALGSFRQLVERWNLTPRVWLIANDLWTDLASDSGFQTLYEPMAQHELILTGRLGTVLGMEVRSDATRHPEHRVLSPGEQFIFSSPDVIGTYTDRGGIETVPIDAGIEKVPGRGWHMSAMQSQTIVNPRAIACGQRVL